MSLQTLGLIISEELIQGYDIIIKSCPFNPIFVRTVIGTRRGDKQSFRDQKRIDLHS